MSPVTRSALVIPSGYASQEVASFIAQLDDLSSASTIRRASSRPQTSSGSPPPA